MIFAQDVESAVTQEEAQAIADASGGGLVLEVGSHYGRSTIALASVARLVHAVDWHRGDLHVGYADTLGIFLANLVRYKVQDKVVPHVGKIEDIAPVLRPRSFDLVFIDAFHEREAVARDGLLCLPLVKPGGTLAFHDYGREMVARGVPFGVTAAVDALTAQWGLEKRVVNHVALVSVPR